MLKQSGNSLEEKQARKAAASLLNKEIRDILLRWEATARALWASSDAQSTPELLDSLPEFLRRLTESLEQPLPRVVPSESLKEIGREHAQQRAVSQHYNIEHVLREYEILRKIVFDVLDRSQLLWPSVRECIMENFADAMVSSTKEYFRFSAARERESANLFRAVFDLAAAGKAVLEARTLRFLMVNRKLCQILGYSEEELLQKDLTSITDSRDWKINGSSLFDRSKDTPVLKYYIRKDGSSVPVMVSAAILPAKDGQPDRVMSTVFDVSVQKETERRFQSLYAITETALKKSTSYRDLLEAMLDHVMTSFDAEYARIEIHEGGEKGENIVERQLGTLPKDADLSVIQAPLSTIHAMNGMLSVGRRKLPEFSKDDRILLDLFGDRIATAVENARLYETSRNTVRELTVERGLRERFVSSLSHDLRTPLTAIQMAAELITPQVGRECESVQLLSKIIENARRADRMIQDLLDANRIRAGEGLGLNIEAANLGQVAEQTISTLESIYGPRFELVVRGRLEGFWCSGSLGRLIENLCSNGLKYGSADGRITIHADGSAPEQVTLSVHNLGSVIPQEKQSELFDLYLRMESSRSQKGWGIGLTIVKGIVTAHGGSISVESGVREGTTFKVILPRDSRAFHSRH